ncbi:hypothetical protein EXIGLDRAFT_468470 [Exidia glandulosa HHB12029]|uniref:F-box domain-containing protein n=1 Tax=Exidia glandulosa HHB12029 TaxID=1314781 RepID=A0A165K0U9_EXIGL|nr:hypothetical protein EXIGLDRAFT_468470 [Exidia glandulosa HHB12029]
MQFFSAIPTELVEHIIYNLDPEDLTRIALVSKALHVLVYETSDKHIWRVIFLTLFDDPNHALPHIAAELPENPEHDPATLYDWRSNLQRRIRARNIMRKFLDASTADRIFCLETLVDIVLTAAPFSDVVPDSRSTTFVHTLLDSYPIPGLAHWIPTTAREHQLKAWLRSFGPAAPKHPDVSNLDLERKVARAFVYDLRNYQRENWWGPYLETKNVNWQHVDAIAQIVLHNLLEHHTNEPSAFPPLGFHNVRRFSARDYSKRAEEDWAGVEGIWTRVVCFMDYRDLMHYNFSAPGPDDPLDTDLFTQINFGEATRVIRVEMVLDKTTPNPQNPRFPIIHVKGRSFQVNGNETYGRLKGTVTMTAQGVVRWQFVRMVSNVGHAPQWGSEGVQVGGVGSAIGILGIWTGVHHQEDDPAGPFWLWKESGPETTIDRKLLLE